MQPIKITTWLSAIKNKDNIPIELTISNYSGNDIIGDVDDIIEKVTNFLIKFEIDCWQVSHKIYTEILYEDKTDERIMGLYMPSIDLDYSCSIDGQLEELGEMMYD